MSESEIVNGWCQDCDICRTDRIPFLTEMPLQQRTTLMSSSVHRTYRKGSTLFHKGQKVDALYIILRGKVKLMNNDGEGREQIVGIFSTYDTIWEGILLEGSAFPYSGVCLTDVRICMIHRTDFINVLKDSAVALNIITMLSRKLHDANERNLLLSMKDPKAKVAAFLLYRQSRDGDYSIDLKLDDIAASLSLRPETVSRKISELAEEGLIRRTGRSSIRIIDFEGLEEVSS